ncbi:hypothetical protein [Salmonella phage SD-13_S19]|nr:hypothetical protein [Salmonella phage SD-11_S17]WPK20301.1 hypothetical protein [Salmonella phage SD-12_S18]WPK20428.1 hypothetical protein [Salmonella phage SD-13_S19]WPK20517.1 hypothetical protein [Salmonella phage SD-14_S20]
MILLSSQLISLSGGRRFKSVHVLTFCFKWNIPRVDLSIILAVLSASTLGLDLSQLRSKYL